ncbi:hypothetical protein BC826DRAFT_969712 [Russula brevipes]|nr:hypothetical protein BC826DRAFT_969712 [Russula brevipes]
MSPHLVFLAENSRSSAVTDRKEDRLGVRWFYAIVTIARKDGDPCTRQGKKMFLGQVHEGPRDYGLDCHSQLEDDQEGNLSGWLERSPKLLRNLLELEEGVKRPVHDPRIASGRGTVRCPSAVFTCAKLLEGPIANLAVASRCEYEKRIGDEGGRQRKD